MIFSGVHFPSLLPRKVDDLLVALRLAYTKRCSTFRRQNSVVKIGSWSEAAGGGDLPW